jgi:hypothetical protein
MNKLYTIINMTIGYRRFLFYTLVLVFIPLSAGIVLYSQGWRIYTEDCKIQSLIRMGAFGLPERERSERGGALFGCISFQKTGAIYIETEPRDVNIKIGNKTFPDKSGILQKGTLVSDLLPKNYSVEITKDGYLPYYKNIRVKPAMVSELLDAILIPKEINNKTPIMRNLRGNLIIAQSNDNKKIIVRNSKNDVYYLYNLGDLSSVFNISAAFNNFRKETITRIAFHPFESNRFIINTKNGFYVLDAGRSKLESVLNSAPTVWTVKNPNIYYIKNVKCQMSNVKCQTLYAYNLVVKSDTELTQLPEEIGEVAALNVSENQNYAAIISDGAELYLFNQLDKSFKKISQNAQGFAFSPDNKKIAVLNKDSGVDVYFLEDYSRGINKKAGETIRLTLKDNQLLKNILWYNDATHLLLQYRDNIRFVELDDRLPLNPFIILNDFSDFFYNLNNNQIYFIQQNSLFSFQLGK